MADDINKTTQEIKNELSQLKDEIEKGKRGLKPAFKELVDLVKESNEPLAKSIIDVREASKNTFAGALQSRKLLQIGNLIGQVSKDASKVSAEQMGQLKKFTDEIEGFDLDRFIQSQQAVNSMNDQIQAIDDSYAARLQTQLSNDKELRKLDDGLQDSNRMLNEVRKKGNKKDIYEYEQLIKEQQKDRTKYIQAQKEIFNQMIEEEKQSIVDKNEAEINIRDEYNDILKQGLKDVAEDSGQFFTDFKKIFGVDLEGPLDNVIEFTNAFGRMFLRNEDLVGDIFRAFGSFKEKFSNGLKSMAEGIGNVMGKIWGDTKAIIAKNLEGTWLGDKLTALKEGASSVLTKMGDGVKSLGKSVAKGASNMLKAGAAFLAASFSAIASALLFAAPYILIGAAIIALVGALVYGAMWLEEKTGVFSSTFEAVKQFFTGVIDGISRAFSGLYEFFAGVFTGDFDRMFAGLTEWFKGIWDLPMAAVRAIADWFKDVFGIDIGQILVDFAKKVLPDWVLNWLGWGGGEGSSPDMENTEEVTREEAAERRRQQRQTLDSAKESGLYDENFLGASTIDWSKAADASTEQLQAILQDDDLSREDKDKLTQMLEQRRQDATPPDALARGMTPETPLTLEEIDNLSTEDQIRLGYAEIDPDSIRRDEDGNITNLEYKATDKYAEQARAEGVSFAGGGPGFSGTARGMTAESILEAAGRGGEIGQATQDVADAQSDVNMQVNTVQQNTNNVSNSSTVTASTGRTRNSDPTASRVAAVPA